MVDFADRSQKQNLSGVAATAEQSTSVANRRNSSFQGVALNHSTELSHTFLEKIKKKLGITSEEDEELLSKLIAEHGVAKVIGKTHVASALEHVVKNFQDVDSAHSVMSQEEIQNYTQKLMTYLTAGDTLLELFIRGNASDRKSDLMSQNKLENDFVSKFGREQFNTMLAQASSAIELNLASEIGYAMGKEGGDVASYVAKVSSPELKRAVAIAYAHGVKDTGLEAAIVDVHNAVYAGEKVAAVTGNPILGTENGSKIAQSVLSSTTGSLAVAGATSSMPATTIAVRDFVPTQNTQLSPEVTLLHLAVLDTANMPRALKQLEVLSPEKRSALLKQYQQSFGSSFEQDVQKHLPASFTSATPLLALVNNVSAGNKIDKARYQNLCEAVAYDYGQVHAAQKLGAQSGVNPLFVVAEFSALAKSLGVDTAGVEAITAKFNQGMAISAGAAITSDFLEQFREVERLRLCGDVKAARKVQERVLAVAQVKGIDTAEIEAQAKHDIAAEFEKAEKITQNVVVAAEYSQGRSVRWLNAGTNEELLLTSLSEASPSEMKLVEHKLLEHAKKLGMSSTDEYLKSELSGLDLEYARAMMSGNKVRAASCGVAWSIDEGKNAHAEKILLSLSDAERKQVVTYLDEELLKKEKLLSAASVDALIVDKGFFKDRSYQDQAFLTALMKGSKEDVIAAKVLQIAHQDEETALQGMTALLNNAGPSRAVVAAKVLDLIAQDKKSDAVVENISSKGLSWLEAEKNGNQAESAYKLLEAGIAKKDSMLVGQMIGVNQTAQIALARGAQGVQAEEFLRNSQAEHTARIQALQQQAASHGTSLEALTKNAKLKDLSSESVDLLIQGKSLDLDTLVKQAVAAKSLGNLQMALQGMNSQQMAQYKAHLKKDTGYDLEDNVESAFKSRQELEAKLFIKYGDATMRSAAERVDVALALADYDTSGVDIFVMGKSDLTKQYTELKKRRKNGEADEALMSLVRTMELQTQTVQMGNMLSDAASRYVVMGIAGAASTAVFFIFPPAGVAGLAATSAIATGVTIGVEVAAGSVLHGTNYLTESSGVGHALMMAPITFASNMTGGSIGLAVSKIGQVGTSVIVEKVGEQALRSGAQVTTRTGAEVTALQVGQAVLDSKLIVRVGSGMARGAAEGYVTGAVQGGGITLVQTGDIRKAIHSAHEAGVMFAVGGALIGGVLSLRRPVYLRNADIISEKALDKALNSGKYDEAMLLGKDIVRAGDLKAAQRITEREAGKILKQGGITGDARVAQLEQLRVGDQPFTYGAVADAAALNAAAKQRAFLNKADYMLVESAQGGAVSPTKVIVDTARDQVSKAATQVEQIAATAEAKIAQAQGRGVTPESLPVTETPQRGMTPATETSPTPSRRSSRPVESTEEILARQGRDGPSLEIPETGLKVGRRDPSIEEVLARQGRDGPAIDTEMQAYVAPSSTAKNRVQNAEPPVASKVVEPTTPGAVESAPVHRASSRKRESLDEILARQGGDGPSLETPAAVSQTGKVSSRSNRGTDTDSLWGAKRGGDGPTLESGPTAAEAPKTNSRGNRGTDTDSLFGKRRGNGSADDGFSGGEGDNGLSLGFDTKPFKPGGNGSHAGGTGNSGGTGSGSNKSGGGSGPAKKSSTNAESSWDHGSEGPSGPQAIEEELVLAGGGDNGFFVGDNVQTAPMKKVKVQKGTTKTFDHDTTLFPGEHNGVELPPTRRGGNSFHGGEEGSAGTIQEVKLTPSRRGGASSNSGSVQEGGVEEVQLTPPRRSVQTQDLDEIKLNDTTRSREDLLTDFRRESRGAKLANPDVEGGAVVVNPHEAVTAPTRTPQPKEIPAPTREVTPQPTREMTPQPIHETAPVASPAPSMAKNPVQTPSRNHHLGEESQHAGVGMRASPHETPHATMRTQRLSTLRRMFPHRGRRGGNVLEQKRLIDDKGEDFIGTHVPDPLMPAPAPDNLEWLRAAEVRVVVSDAGFVETKHMNYYNWRVSRGSFRTANKADGE